jgi:hypothetical protein
MNSTAIITGSTAVAGRELVCNVYGAQRLHAPGTTHRRSRGYDHAPSAWRQAPCWPWATGNSNRPAHDPQLGAPSHPSRHEQMSWLPTIKPAGGASAASMNFTSTSVQLNFLRDSKKTVRRRRAVASGQASDRALGKRSFMSTVYPAMVTAVPPVERATQVAHTRTNNDRIGTCI